MKRYLLSVGLLVAGLTGAVLFGYSLVQQTAIQGQMNHTMALINGSIVSTGAVVKQTSQALQPLADTTQALATIEQQEERTVSDLNSMNDHLASTATTERNIIQNLDTLNRTTNGVSADLASMSQINDSLLQASSDSVDQAKQEARGVGTLNAMTQTSISELHTLNGKLAPLRLLPSLPLP